MTTKEIKELALQILNRNGETGIKKSDYRVGCAYFFNHACSLTFCFLD